jgi:hypothetical protein
MMSLISVIFRCRSELVGQISAEDCGTLTASFSDMWATSHLLSKYYSYRKLSYFDRKFTLLVVTSVLSAPPSFDATLPCIHQWPQMGTSQRFAIK